MKLIRVADLVPAVNVSRRFNEDEVPIDEVNTQGTAMTGRTLVGSAPVPHILMMHDSAPSRHREPLHLYAMRRLRLGYDGERLKSYLDALTIYPCFIRSIPEGRHRIICTMEGGLAHISDRLLDTPFV